MTWLIATVLTIFVLGGGVILWRVIVAVTTLLNAINEERPW